MGARMWGADVDALRALAGELDQAGHRVESIGRQIGRVAYGAPWHGTDAERFRADWSGLHRSVLNRVAAALADAAQALHRNADEQDAASREGGGVLATGGARLGVVPTAVPSGPAGTQVDDGSREDQRQQSRRDAGGGDAKPDSAHQIPGPEPFRKNGGLGEGVPGTTVAIPEPPVWNPPDRGSDENGSSWNTEKAGFGDRAKEWGVRQAANALSVSWPDAARNLHHYLGNSGETLNQPVGKMLQDMPLLSGDVQATESLLGANAIRLARESGASGPMTFPVNTAWIGHDAENRNWYLATGSFQYNITGQVTAYPPTTAGGEWRYEMESVVNTRDRYNWDGNKSTDILGINVSDEELQEFHRKGLAQEFNMVCSSSPRASQGTG